MKATIAIPFYNNEQTLEDSIKSVINQTFTSWKLLLINDGSTDQSLEIANKFLQDERIRLIDDGLNKGLIFRLNQAIDLTETPYFVRMDSDDIMMTKRLEKQIEMLEEDASLDLVGSSAYIIDESNKINSFRKSSNSKSTVKDVVNGGLFIHPTVTGRTEWFKNNKYDFEYNRAEDLELWCRKIDDLKYYNIKEPLLFYRDPMNINIPKYKASSITVKKIIRKYLNARDKKKILFKETLKINMYQMLSILGMSSVINERRNPPIDERQIILAEKELESALMEFQVEGIN